MGEEKGRGQTACLVDPFPFRTSMHQDPVYQGYVTTDHGQPTLIYSSGFLVQSDAHAALCGWHAFRNAHQIMSNVDTAFFRRLVAAKATPAAMTPLMLELIDSLSLASQSPMP